MTSPKHAIDVRGKGRYYTGCQPGCPLGDDKFISVTNAQGVVAKPALVPAAAKVTAEKAWEVLPLMVAYSRQPEDGAPADGGKPCSKRTPVSTRCGRCRFCLNMAIKAAHRNEWEKAADLGTRIHAHAHAHVLDRPLPYDEEVHPFLDQYLDFLTRWRVDLDRHVEAAELTVFDRRHGYAGTGDLWIHLPLAYDAASGATRFTGWGKRRLWLVDLKTSRTKPAGVVYADQPLQLAGLRYAAEALLPDESVVKVPRFEGAAILNLRETEHALVPQPADRAVHKAFLGAVTLQRMFHDQDVKAWERTEPPVVEPKPAKAVA